MKNTLLTLTAIFFFSIAGFSQNVIPVATQVTLNGAGTDKDGTIASYQWKQLSGPVTTTKISSPTSAVTVITGFDTAGSYTYELTVTDNQGAFGKATAIVNVYAANLPPVATITPSVLDIQLPMK